MSEVLLCRLKKKKKKTSLSVGEFSFWLQSLQRVKRQYAWIKGAIIWASV